MQRILGTQLKSSFQTFKNRDSLGLCGAGSGGSSHICPSERHLYTDQRGASGAVVLWCGIMGKLQGTYQFEFQIPNIIFKVLVCINYA